MMHKTLFEGDTSFCDSPAKINKALFEPHQEWWTLEQSLDFRPDILLRVEWGLPQRARMGSRIVLPMRTIFADGRTVYQPFYRSAGLSTPDISPEGTWWPTCGIYTRAYCKYRGLPLHLEGFIGKKFFYKGKWYSHNKKWEILPPLWKKISEWLAISEKSPS